MKNYIIKKDGNVTGEYNNFLSAAKFFLKECRGNNNVQLFELKSHAFGVLSLEDHYVLIEKNNI